MLAAGTHWKIKYKTASQGKKVFFPLLKQKEIKLTKAKVKYQMTFKDFVMDTMEQNIGWQVISGIAVIASTLNRKYHHYDLAAVQSSWAKRFSFKALFYLPNSLS